MKIVAVKERSDGNEYAGSSWVETAIFDPETPLIEVLRWAHPRNKNQFSKDEKDLYIHEATSYGRLMLTVAAREEGGKCANGERVSPLRLPFRHSGESTS